MKPSPFDPTPEQQAVITHNGPAFISACPGAGKTRVLVERARRLISGPESAQGVAFLSFTKAAIFELEGRLKREGLLPGRVFPNFSGTFDSFIWQFFVAPFGVPGCAGPPRLIPDKDKWTIEPFKGAQPLPLRCFDRVTGAMIAALAVEAGYDPSTRKVATTAAYSACARSRFDTARVRGHVDFEDVRSIAIKRLADSSLSARLGPALRARFREIIVDEAQDCNPVDLQIIDWLRSAGIITKVICDPHQAIYGFRGGVNSHLVVFGQSFASDDQKPMTGNFRSSPAICSAIASLRPATAAVKPDQPLGKYRDDRTPINLLAYGGHAVTAKIGEAFKALIQPLGLSVADCPVLASTRDSAGNAIGQPPGQGKTHLTLRLAAAVTDFHYAFDIVDRKAALEAAHKVFLELRGLLDERTYHQYLLAEEISGDQWRPEMLELVRSLRFCQQRHPTPKDWLTHAQNILAPMLPHGVAVTQKLRNHKDLSKALVAPPTSCPPARTIHSVKGLEFPAVCVVMTTQTAGKIIDFLQTGTPQDHEEDARKIYVAASRAERLLAIAIPKGSAARMEAHLASAGAAVNVLAL